MPSKTERFEFPANELLGFLSRAKYAVYRARRNSRRLAAVKRYDEIRDILQRYFPRDTIHFFGSRAIGLGTHKSDIDIYIEVNGTFFQGLDRERAVEMVGDLTRKLRKNQNFAVQMGIETSTVPVIKCTYIPKRLKCKYSGGISG